jgi:hypothetical protein
MTGVRVRGEQVRKYVIEQVERHPSDIARVTAEYFGISRQAAHKHLRNLLKENAIVSDGKTRRRYRLAPLVEWRKVYPLAGLAEDVVWRDDVAPALGEMASNVSHIWAYAFTEMLNNAIDHSGGQNVSVHVQKTAASTTITIRDDGIGIFRKIQEALGLLDERHSVIELAKGKLTTDPANHTGQGIFFSSRMMDQYQILSGGVYFGHSFGNDEDWVMERNKENAGPGTFIFMSLDNHTARTTTKIFDQYSTPDTLGFTKTVVPVRLAQYGNNELVSRSAAKRLLERVDRFQTVIFDFTDVPTIGQAFADEIFRVFARRHPQMELIDVNTATEVEQMIARARAEPSPPAAAGT